MEQNKEAQVKKIDLTWIVVSDLEKAKKFFTETIGLKISEYDDQTGWLELAGHEGGATLGICQSGKFTPISPGNNAVTTFTVENIEQATKNLIQNNVKLIGEILEVPGQVKLQLFVDPDGNLFQLVEPLNHK